MDQGQFTTTFIPKKPLTEAVSNGAPVVSRPVGLFSTIVTILFFLTIAIGGGMYFWKSYVTKNVAVLADSVSKVEKAFEPQLITQLQSLDKQLKNGSALVKNHTVVSPIFDMLSLSTIKQLRFTKLDIARDDVKGVSIKMSGESGGYESIAQQSDVFAGNTYLKDTIFSNFFLTSKGKVSFDVSFGVKPEFVDFEKAPLTAPTQ